MAQYRGLVETLAFVIGILVIVVGLALSIAVHEFGHLIPAKLFKVRVGQYMIGFGPKIWSKKIRGTEYGFKAIPLGGYISMAGMYPPAPDAKASRRSKNLFRSLVQDAQTDNDETLQDVPENERFYNLSVWKKLIIMLGGPVMNLLLAILLFTLVYSGIGTQAATLTIDSVSSCPADSVSCTVVPAEKAGFLAGDKILSVDGEPIADFATFAAVVADSPNKPLRVEVERGGDIKALTLTPELRAPLEEGGAERGYAGVFPAAEYQRQPIWAGTEMAYTNTAAVLEMIVQLPAMVSDAAVSTFTGQERNPNGPLSVVGVSIIAGEVAASDQAPVLDRVVMMLLLLGSLNIALFAFNLIPLLPLDGGHVVVALWDGVRNVIAKLRGKPKPRPSDALKLMPLTFAVFALLIVMGAILIIADLVNPINLLG